MNSVEIWTDFTPFSSVSIVDFEQVNVNWVMAMIDFNKSFNSLQSSIAFELEASRLINTTNEKWVNRLFFVIWQGWYRVWKTWKTYKMGFWRIWNSQGILTEIFFSQGKVRDFFNRSLDRLMNRCTWFLFSFQYCNILLSLRHRSVAKCHWPWFYFFVLRFQNYSHLEGIHWFCKKLLRFNSII